MTDPRAVRIAVELKLLGVSRAGVVELLSNYPYEQIERQLAYLPFRNAKRPEAFIIDAVRNDYSQPKEFFYASSQAPHSSSVLRLDKDAKPRARSTPADAQRHRTPRAPRRASPIDGLEPGGAGRDLAVPSADVPDRETQ